MDMLTPTFPTSFMRIKCDNGHEITLKSLNMMLMGRNIVNFFLSNEIIVCVILRLQRFILKCKEIIIPYVYTISCNFKISQPTFTYQMHPIILRHKRLSGRMEKG